MSYIQVIPNMNLPAAPGQETIERTFEGERFGHFPHRVALLTPGARYVDEALGTIRNRSIRNGASPVNRGSVVLGTFPDTDIVCFNADENGERYRANPNAEVNPNEWSISMAIQTAPNAVNSNVQRFVSPVSAQTELQSFNAGLSNIATVLSVYSDGAGSGSASQRLRYEIPVERQHVRCVWTITFSTALGLRLYYNHELVHSEPDEREPLAYGFGPGEWEMHRNLWGYHGDSTVWNMDLSVPQNAGFRHDLIAALIEKHQIGIEDDT